MSNIKYSKAGNPIYTFSERDERKLELVTGEWENIEIISNHIEAHIGEVSKVIHEVVSDQVHIDIHIVDPSKELPFFCLITSGMSDKPMNTPVELENSEFIEVMMLLPKNWIEKKDGNYNYNDFLMDDEHYWPIRELLQTARYPHKYNSWLGYGHTMHGPDLKETFSSNTELSSIILLPSISISEDFFELKINESKIVTFYCLWTLFNEELQYKLDNGTEALIELFIKNGIRDIVSLKRKNTLQNSGFFNWFRLKGRR